MKVFIYIVGMFFLLGLMYFTAIEFFEREHMTLKIFQIIIFAYALCLVVVLFQEIIKEVKKDFE